MLLQLPQAWELKSEQLWVLQLWLLQLWLLHSQKLQAPALALRCC